MQKDIHNRRNVVHARDLFCRERLADDGGVADGIDQMCIRDRIKFTLSPVYVALAAFCFSMTIGVLWEFFEFGMDRLFHMDMQKDTIVHTISSVMLDPTNSNIPITIDGITSVAVNGRDLGFTGYLDIGLYDTMEDLFVNFIGATVFSVIRCV